MLIHNINVSAQSMLRVIYMNMYMYTSRFHLCKFAFAFAFVSLASNP